MVTVSAYSDGIMDTDTMREKSNKTCTHRNAHTCTHRHMHTHTDMRTDTHTHTCTCTCTQIHTHVLTALSSSPLDRGANAGDVWMCNAAVGMCNAAVGICKCWGCVDVQFNSGDAWMCNAIVRLGSNRWGGRLNAGQW